MGVARRVPKTIVMIAAALSIAAACVALSGSKESPDPRAPIVHTKGNGEWSVRMTTEHGWYPGYVGVANRQFKEFKHYTIEPGDGTFVRIYIHTWVVDSMDGYGSLELTFQLPPNPKIGKQYRFDAIPSDRRVLEKSEYKHLCRMQVGEVTAEGYGNPDGGTATDKNLLNATLTVLTANPDGATVRVRLKAEPHHYVIDVDDEYELRTMADGAVSKW